MCYAKIPVCLYLSMTLVWVALMSPAKVSANETCQLSLAYKDKGKAGYMERAPSNEGLYQAIYSELATSIGCELVIHRYPKKRTLLLLERGDVDIYPSTGFNLSRSEFMLYLPNGLYRFEPYVGLAPRSVAELTSIRQISDYGLSWIFEAGNTTVEQAEAFGVDFEQIVDLTDARAVDILSKGRDVFYRMIAADYKKLLDAKGLTDLSSLNISTHKGCCEAKSQKLYLGFSRASKHYAEVPNDQFDDVRPISAENFPTRLDPDSVAFKVATELKKLEKSGRINELFIRYIHDAGHTP